MEVGLDLVDGILARYPGDESSLIMVLQDIQAAARFLPCEALERVADRLAIPRARVFSAATFYRAFSLSPKGRVVIQVCKGTACHVQGAQLIEDALCRRLDVPVGGTTKDLQITLETVNCVGACAMAPVVIMADRYEPAVKPAHVERLVRRATKLATAEPASRARREVPVAHFDTPAALRAHARLADTARQHVRGSIRVCGGRGCLAAGAQGVFDALREAATAASLPILVELDACHEAPDAHLLTTTGCQGCCQQGPLVQVEPGDVLYAGAKATDAAAIVDGIVSGRPVDRLRGEHPSRTGHPFYRGQEVRALSFCGRIDPESFDEYLALGGFAALARALSDLRPAQVIDLVEASGLRGRGGAGFPTARKWRTALRAAERSGDRPYVLCNGDEGDPGAFMDAALMEGAPFQVVEGMILGAWALGAREGVIYVRAEYPLAVRRLEHALDVCRRAGLLGHAILGSPLDFDIRISRGGGAFVCGESTALMRSIEGKVGEPRAKYVRSAERGLFDRPTVLNNVETWALVPGIVEHGSAWLSSLGTSGSKGTKVFSLVGQVRRTGLVEVPMGTTLRNLVFEIGGGMREGHRFKAVQTGGPSGGCLPESCLDRPIDFEALADAGSMMGSGGMIVMSDETCMVDVASYFVRFLQEESCGKCVPCRLGLPQLSHLLDEVRRGRATAEHLSAIEDVAKGMAESSLCGLGTSAPNPVLSTLRYFRDEYEAHGRGVCPAGVCKDLIRYEISPDCPGCLACLKLCPTHGIRGVKDQVHVIDAELCDKCGICRSICKFDAVRIVPAGAR